MGAMALLRQTFYDAQWHAQCKQIWHDHPIGNEPPQRNDALDALNDVLASEHKQPVLFDATDEQNALRAVRLAREFGLDLVLLGSGMEFRRLDEIIAARTPLIVPLEFPKRPDVSTVAVADSVSLRDLMTWEQAPTNARRLISAGATVAFTTLRLKSRGDFPANLRSAIKHGLTEDQALAALTTTPAKLLGVDNFLGTIAPGKAANLIVVKGSLFDKDGKIYETWINGRRYEINKDAEVQLKGSGTLKTDAAREIKVDLDTTKSIVTLHLPDDKKVSAKKIIVQQDQLSFIVDGRPFDVEGYVRLSGVIEGNSVTGTGALPNGSTFAFTMEITPKPPGDEGKSEPDTQPADKPGAENPKPDAEPKPENAAAAAGGGGDPVSGTWTIRIDQMPEGTSIIYTLKLQGRSVGGTVSMMGREREISGGTFDPSTGKLSYSTETPGGTSKAEAIITGDTMTGTISSPRGERAFSGTRASNATSGAKNGKDKSKEDEGPFTMPPEKLNSPLGEYGLTEAPKPQSVLFTNATIWTCGPQGVIHNGSMLVLNGKVRAIGEGASAGNVPDAVAIKTIDVKGKDITPGLIDCHSHTGIDGGVNEFGQTNTAECRISDCIDPDDIDWYRELAGGLTACNQLHGSANPIGGQNSVVKLKWGAAGGADAFPITDAIAGVKFALGENVKRSSGRYPNSRMGVEAFYRDAFTSAKHYEDEWNRYDGLPPEIRAKPPPRVDL